MCVIPAGEQLFGACATPVPTSGTTRSASIITTSSADAPPIAVDPQEVTGKPGPYVFPEEGRVSPGTVIAGRYRVLDLLGKGGMGEVYRVNDLKLGQTVALKFLTHGLARDPARASRLLHEVRLARQVSHPNVCRVYDVGEDAGEHFISMEYVRGEDLRRLLRRIGRFPHDKAVQIARQLCAGLAAAHAEGILHRDLKPANILLDDRGVAHIMDFGLAVLAGQGTRAGEGTPAYMAPEQLAGERLSIRSDLYSLGLVLYELFTGQRMFRGQTPAELLRERSSAGLVSPSTVVADLHPAIERVILRCLEVDPHRRPISALAVSVMMPGGDALAEALAAGDTPSPSLVAAAGETEGLRPGVALSCLAGVMAALAVVVPLGGDIADHVHADYTPQALASKARELLQQAGHRAEPVDAAGGFERSIPYLRLAQAGGRLRSRRAQPRLAFPSIVYWYRQSPQHLVSTDFFSVVSPDSPPPVVPGMIGIELDPQGRLVSLQVMPPDAEESTGPAVEPDWSMLFAAAGLDRAHFEPVSPRWTPLGFADSRRAWQATGSAPPDMPLRVEAAGYRGVPVGFAIVTPWTDSRRVAGRPNRLQTPTGVRVQLAQTATLVALLGTGLALTFWNLRQRRGDRRGAERLAVFVIALLLAVWLLKTNHVPTLGEFLQFVIAAGWGLSLAAMFWSFYIATEPYVRRRWPHMLISWTRLLAGDWRDPLVGRDVLVGMLAALGVGLVRHAYLWLIGAPRLVLEIANLRMLQGLRSLLAETLFLVPGALFWGLGGAFLLLLLAGLLRRDWLASVVFLVLVVAPGAIASDQLWLALAYGTAIWACRLILLFRFGLLAVVVHSFVWMLLRYSPLTTDLTAWYSGPTLFVVTLIVGAATWGCVRSLGGRGLPLDDLFARKA
jgi:serine/threonine-protein kinase